MGRLGVVLFIVLCFGMAGGTYMLTIHQPTRTMQKAVTVEGTVTATDVVSGSTSRGSSYSAVITYEYRFDGQTYTNDDYALVGGPSFVSPRGAREFLESYTAGDRVTVYVVPQNPSNSFLKRGAVGLYAYAIMAGLVLLGLLGVVGLVGDLRGAEWVDIK